MQLPLVGLSVSCHDRVRELGVCLKPLLDGLQMTPEAMLTLGSRTPKPPRGYVANAAPVVWDCNLAVGRAKVYLVGNPFAEDIRITGEPDPHLQVVHCSSSCSSYSSSFLSLSSCVSSCSGITRYSLSFLSPSSAHFASPHFTFNCWVLGCNLKRQFVSLYYFCICCCIYCMCPLSN